MKTLSELEISKAPWGTYQTKKEVAVTTSEEGFGDLESALCRGPRRKSNARLIAAAPKLYEAVYDLLEIVENVSEYIGVDCNTMNKVEKARSALAEASGESEVVK